MALLHTAFLPIALCINAAAVDALKLSVFLFARQNRRMFLSRDSKLTKENIYIYFHLLSFSHPHPKMSHPFVYRNLHNIVRVVSIFLDIVDLHFGDASVWMGKKNEKKKTPVWATKKVHNLTPSLILTTIALVFHRNPSPHVVLHAIRFQCVTSQSIFVVEAEFILFWSKECDDDDDKDLTSVCEYDCNLPTYFPVEWVGRWLNMCGREIWWISILYNVFFNIETSIDTRV